MTAPVWIAGDGIGVVFERREDRYAHRIVALGGAASDDALADSLSVLESLEGSPGENWPESPPLQELHVEPRGQCHVALLVGRAGTSHWSASFEFADGRLIVDVACRVAAQPARLGSTYWLAPQTATLGAADAATMKLVGDAGAWSFAAESPECEVRGEQRLLQIRPARVSAPPATVRWRYSIRREST